MENVDDYDTVEQALKLINDREQWDGSSPFGWQNLEELLQDGIHWSDIEPATIIPKMEIRAFCKKILDKEVRLDVMKFLFDYAEYYFSDGARELAWEGEISMPGDVIKSRIRNYISEFRSELSTQITQIEKTGAYSGDKFHKQEARIKELEEQNEKLEEIRHTLINEIEILKARIDALEHPERGHQIPDELQCEEVYYIMHYLQQYRVVTPKPVSNAYYGNQLCYHWNKTKVLFGYFVCKVCYLLELRTKNDHLIWTVFKQAFDNFDALEKQARDHASKNRNWENASSKKPDEAYIIDEALEYSAEKIANSKARKQR